MYERQKKRIRKLEKPRFSENAGIKARAFGRLNQNMTTSPAGFLCCRSQRGLGKRAFLVQSCGLSRPVNLCAMLDEKS